MYYTGKIIIIEEDTNPNSPTYGNTRTTEQESEFCDFKPNMKLISEYNEDGIDYETWQDINEYSPTYNQLITIEKNDITALNSLYKSECLQILYNDVKYGNSGYRKDYYVDLNPYSETYKETSENTTEDLLYCSLPDKTPEEEESYYCETGTYQGITINTGWKTVIKTDINPYSDTYGDVISTSRIIDEDICKVANSDAYLKLYCSMCEIVDGERTGYKIKYYTDFNRFSSTYTPENIYITVRERSEECNI